MKVEASQLLRFAFLRPCALLRLRGGLDGGIGEGSRVLSLLRETFLLRFSAYIVTFRHLT